MADNGQDRYLSSAHEDSLSDQHHSHDTGPSLGHDHHSHDGVHEHAHGIDQHHHHHSHGFVHQHTHGVDENQHELDHPQMEGARDLKRNKVHDNNSENTWKGADGKMYHSHDGLAPHTHEPIESPGFFSRRAPPLSMRNLKERAFTIGIGGPVGTGKTALMLALCRALRDKYSIAAVTNDIFTKEDGEFLVRNGALAPERIRAVETGGCPHAAIREDISINLGPLEELSHLFAADILLCESGGDNLAANFSRELADYIIYIIDVSGGDKIPRKGGPGITQADLLVINKTDLAEAIGADLKVMENDSLRMRDGGPFVFAQVKHGKGVYEIVGHILNAFEAATHQQAVH